MPNEIIVALIALVTSVIGGISGALVTNLANRGKTKAETEKLKAETEKISLENLKLRTEVEHLSSTKADVQQVNETVQKLTSTVAEVSYELTAKRSTSEDVLYDGTRNLEGYDFKGEVNVINRVIMVNRVPAVFWLVKYEIAGRTSDYIPASGNSEVARRFRVSCEARISQGSCSVRFHFRDRQDSMSLAIDEQIVDGSNWESVDLFFRVPTNTDIHLGVNVQPLASPVGALEIRNLVVVEKRLD
jgi:cell division protein FtsB